MFRNLMNAEALRGGATGLRRALFWTLLLGGLLLLVLLLAAGAFAVWLVLNADAALAWVNGVLAQLGPIVNLVRPLTGG